MIYMADKMRYKSQIIYHLAFPFYRVAQGWEEEVARVCKLEPSCYPSAIPMTMVTWEDAVLRNGWDSMKIINRNLQSSPRNWNVSSDTYTFMRDEL